MKKLSRVALYVVAILITVAVISLADSSDFSFSNIINFMKVDDCLNSGGRWDYTNNICDK